MTPKAPEELQAEIAMISAKYLRPSEVQRATDFIWHALQCYRCAIDDVRERLSPGDAVQIKTKIVVLADQLSALVDEHLCSEWLADAVGREFVAAGGQPFATEGFIERVQRDLSALAAIFDRAELPPLRRGNVAGLGRHSLMFARKILEVYDRFSAYPNAEAFYGEIAGNFGVSTASLSRARKEFPKIDELIPSTWSELRD